MTAYYNTTKNASPKPSPAAYPTIGPASKCSWTRNNHLGKYEEKYERNKSKCPYSYRRRYPAEHPGTGHRSVRKRRSVQFRADREKSPGHRAEGPAQSNPARQRRTVPNQMIDHFSLFAHFIPKRKRRPVTQPTRPRENASRRRKPAP